ncbi:MAG: DUF177 domain-containing protein [Gemmatimonadetes bacterium]|nr:DUF177 domain-containing protein [Gemmatimonadota bacterium]NNF12881.1 DUF177 domain-containing protein [Gemmatimonadota bacterium]
MASDDDLWKDTDLEWAGKVKVGVRASYAGTGEVVARGRIAGTLVQECRRCLERVDTEFAEELTMVFVDDADEDEDGGAYALDPVGEELELSKAVREEVLLAANPFVVCKPECRGLCPLCGLNLNEGSCDCSTEEADPRWAALRELKSE